MKSSIGRLAFIIFILILAVLTKSETAAAGTVPPMPTAAGCAGKPAASVAPSGQPRAEYTAQALSSIATWAHTFGTNDFVTPSSVAATGDGGYVVAGYLGDEATGLVFKVDSNGHQVWAKTFTHSYTNFKSVALTGDGGYIVAGSSGGFFGTYATVFKLDASGNLLWSKFYTGNGIGYGLWSIAPTNDGGYIAAGYQGIYDSWVAKLDASGNILWSETYGGGGFDGFQSALPTADGGYFVGMTTESYGAGDGDAWILKLDGSGNILWQRAYGGSDWDWFRSGTPTSDGGYIAAGITRSFGAGFNDAWVFKVDGTGNMVWQKTYGSSGYDGAMAIAPAQGGGYAVYAYGSEQPLWVFKLAESGDLAWSKTLPGGTPYSIAPTPDGGYITADEVAYKAELIKLDTNGDIHVDCPIEGTSSPTIMDSTAMTTDSSATVSIPQLQLGNVSFTVADLQLEELNRCVTFEDPSLAIQYDGWQGVTNANANGGGYRVSGVKGEAATFTFAGTNVTWITQRGPDQGIAGILIDGINSRLVDLYSPQVGYQIKVSTGGLQNKRHTLTVVVTGEKNGKSSGTNIVVDAFDVGHVIIQESGLAVQYDTWEGMRNANASGGTLRFSGTKGAVAAFTFNGTSVNWVTETCPMCGMADVVIDGVDRGQVDLYSAEAQWQVLKSYTGLSDGQHTLHVWVLGSKNPSASGTNVAVDAFTVP